MKPWSSDNHNKAPELTGCRVVAPTQNLPKEGHWCLKKSCYEDYGKFAKKCLLQSLVLSGAGLYPTCFTKKTLIGNFPYCLC